MLATVLNLKHRPEKLIQFKDQDLLPGEYNYIEAIYNDLNGLRGCTASHLLAMESFKKNRINAIFEDDCLFQNQRYFEKALSELPEDWDMLYLGGQMNLKEVTDYSPNLVKVKSLFATHAILYNGTKVSDYVLKNWSVDKIHDLYRSNDTFFVRILQNRFNVYCANPMIAIQRDNISDTNNRLRSYKWQ